MRFSRSLFSALPLLLSAGVAAQEPAAKVVPDINGYRELVAPFFQVYCNKCHGSEKPKGDLSLTALNGELAAGKDLSAYVAIAERLKAGEMPPETEKTPPIDAIRKVTGWIESELAKAGKGGAVAAGSFKTGNHVPHDMLFGPKATIPFDAPPRVWRISPAIYEEMMKAINKNAKIGQPFAVPPGEGFKDVAGAFTIDEPTASQLIRNAENVVKIQLGTDKGKAVAEFAPLLDEKNPPSRTQVERAIRKQFDIVLKRRPTDDELSRLVALHEKNVETGGANIGTATTLMTVFLLPQANFRFEVGAGPSDHTGKRMLAPRELAFAISYALSDSPPDGKLLDAADKGQLTTPEDVRREVKRLFEDPKSQKPRLLRFFREYFRYTEAVNVFKDQKDFPAHDARVLIADTDRLIADILAEDKNVLEELLTTNKSYVAYKVADGAKAAIAKATKTYEDAVKKDPKKARKSPDISNKSYFLAYNLKDFPETQPTHLPREERAGILTQPSWLVAFSENKDNHPIQRGKWIRERLLGGTVPDIPIGVDAQLPEDAKKTLRERMEVTTKEYCWQCHQRMNRLGVAFENFDGFGRFRTTEIDRPVVTTGWIDKSGDPKLDGEYQNPIAMIHQLAKSERVRQVFVRHAFRYWLGRDETPGDAKSLQAADRAYVESGGSMKALVTALLTSESFLYRSTHAGAKE